MTCTPTITVRKSSNSTSTGGLFQPSTATVTLVVHYCNSCTGGSIPPETPFQVLEDVNGTYWDIVVGRPLAEIDANGNRTAWLQAYSADMTFQDVADVNAGTKDYAYYYVKDYSCRQILEGDPGLWEISINVSMMKVDSAAQYPHCSVDIQTTSRMASAWRLGPGTGTDVLKVPTTNATATGPMMGSLNAGGFWEPKNWRGQNSTYQDVNGFDIDINGNPMSVAIEQIRYTISFVVRRPYIGLISSSAISTIETNSTWDEWVGNAGCYVNKRNDTTMFGYRPGELLCEAINVTPIDEQFSKASIVLVWDEWGHFDQQIWSPSGRLGGLSDQSYSYTGGATDRFIRTALAVFWTTSYQEAFRVVGMSGAMPMGVYSIADAAISEPDCHYTYGG
jgi:hypothetical protein